MWVRERERERSVCETERVIKTFDVFFICMKEWGKRERKKVRNKEQRKERKKEREPSHDIIAKDGR